mmetsp:Transcript_1289/g.3089  ORF Transcript_1289/g.3089 Transcript_1289/m.3089 type:complete len:203 (-) Transcript_1289:2259-2867(-)
MYKLALHWCQPQKCWGPYWNIKLGLGPDSLAILPFISDATWPSRLSLRLLPPPFCPSLSMIRDSTGASSQSGWMRAIGLVWCQGGELGRSCMYEGRLALLFGTTPNFDKSSFPKLAGCFDLPSLKPPLRVSFLNSLPDLFSSFNSPSRSASLNLMCRRPPTDSPSLVGSARLGSSPALRRAEGGGLGASGSSTPILTRDLRL